MTIQKFVHEPEEISALRFYNNNREIEEFLEENNEACCMDYEWRFCVQDNEPLLEIRKPLPERGVYQIIDVPRGDYISSDENGLIIHMYEEDINEFYDEVKEEENKVCVNDKIMFAMFNGNFSTITSVLDKLNSKLGYDRYEYFCHESPCVYMEICDLDRSTHLNLVKGTLLIIGKDGSLFRENEHE